MIFHLVYFGQNPGPAGLTHLITILADIEHNLTCRERLFISTQIRLAYMIAFLISSSRVTERYAAKTRKHHRFTMLTLSPENSKATLTDIRRIVLSWQGSAGGEIDGQYGVLDKLRSGSSSVVETRYS